MDFPIIILLAGFWIGLAKGGIGGPIAGAVLLPLLTQIMPYSEAVGITLPLLIFADFFALRSYWRTWDMRHFWLMMPAAVFGVAIGTWLLVNLSDTTLKHILGIFALIILIYKLLSDSLKTLAYNHRPWHGYLAGFTAGFGSALANTGGPPVTAYLLLQRLPPLTFVGTNALFFAVLNWIKLPGFLLSGVLVPERLGDIILMFPVIPLGVVSARYVVTRINPKIFEYLMMVLLAFAAFILLFGNPFS